ncbi:hypothetical protein GE21DRAFT_1341337 [Neurospora crassa]|uniref:Uncharacterized protein B7N4.090 n=1 Tax=Neurospora crassa TaxID=5141 RepID=Q96U01_NEUCS|nr:hypothetical protein GE21DRAFT_1341337 [Neurospora crassa]CAD11437.1 hypothetical protein [Neurospora crassa]
MTCSVVLAIKQVGLMLMMKRGSDGLSGVSTNYTTARHQMIMICISYPVAGCSTVDEAWSLESLAGLQGRRGSVGAVPGARLPGTRGKHGSRVMRSARHRALEIERMKWFINCLFYFDPRLFPRISEPLFSTWENGNRTGKAFSAVAGWQGLSIDIHVD